MNNATETSASSHQEILDWLAAPAVGAPLDDLTAERRHATSLGGLRLPPLHLLKIVELLQARVEQTEAALVPLLLDARLPLPSALASAAQDMIETRAGLGDAWLKLATECPADSLGKVRRSPVQLCLRGLDNLERQLMTALLIAVPTPLKLWRNIATLYLMAREGLDPTATLPVEMSLAESRFKAMLALATAQPEGLSPREIAFLGEYVARHASAIQLDGSPPGDEADWFWLDAELDQPPLALARREPGNGHCLYFRCGELADLVDAHLRQVDQGTPPAQLGLPIQAAGADYRNALSRARQCWSAPRRRSFNRRSQSSAVEVCIHLGTLWTALGGNDADAPRATRCELATSDWTLINEGPAGYAMVHVAGQVDGLVPGCAVGLRASPDAPWQICVVRWARSEGSHHVGLGLEVIAPSAQPVRLQTQGARDPQAPVPALLLPALPSLGRSEALLTARGDYNSRPFLLLQDIEERLQVTECMPRRSLVETASVEVFEFSREPRAS